MAQSTVKLIVDAQNAISPLKRVNDATKNLSNNTNKLKDRLNKSNRSIRESGRAANSASTGFATLNKSLLPLLKVLAAVAATRFVIFQTAELETQTKALTVLTGSAEKAQKIVQEIKEFGAVTPFKSSELIEVAKRMKAFGFETEKVVDMTQRVADIAGTVGADINNVALAIGKVQAKNKFMQEENVMLLEKGINVTKELENLTGKNAEGVAEAMRKGEISADLFAQAIINLTSKGGEFFEGASKQSDTLAGKFSTLVDRIETLAQLIGNELKPALKNALDIAIKGVNAIEKIFGRFKNISDIGLGFEVKAEMDARKQATRLTKTKFGDDIRLTGFAFTEEEKAARQFLAEQTNLLKEQFIQTEKLKRLKFEEKETQDKIKESVTASKNEAAIINQETTLLNESLGQTDTAVKTIKDNSNLISDGVKKAKTETDGLKTQFAEIGETIGSQITDALVGAINGTKSLGESARNVLNDLANSILKSGINSLLGGVFGGTKIGGFLGFANGGRPPVGRASIVGERGPELFVPSTAGTIIPNNQLGGGSTNNIVVNVNMEGGVDAQADENDSRELGTLLGLKVRDEIIKQQRPGGLLANTR